MLVLRDVQKTDLPGLKRLAAVLNTVNLPNNEETLTAIIDKSVKSFAGKVKEPARARVPLRARGRAQRAHHRHVDDHRPARHLRGAAHLLRGDRARALLGLARTGTSGTRCCPSAYNYEGPTEIGGLVVDPPYRATPDKPGKQLSYVRFLFMAMHRRLFRPRVLAELLPPLLPDGRSLLWEACGKKFTGPQLPGGGPAQPRRTRSSSRSCSPPRTSTRRSSPTRVQKVLGEVGPQTRGVQRMLERIGFRYVERIDPFDGGPHFEAEPRGHHPGAPLPHGEAGRGGLRAEGDDVLVASERESGRNRFRAVRTTGPAGGSSIALPARARPRRCWSVSRGREAVPHSLRVSGARPAAARCGGSRAAAPASAPPPPREGPRGSTSASGRCVSGSTGSSDVGSSSSMPPARQRHAHPRMWPRRAPVHHQQPVHHPHPLPLRRRLRREAQRMGQAPSRLALASLAPVRRPGRFSGNAACTRFASARAAPASHAVIPGSRAGTGHGGVKASAPSLPSTGIPSAKSSGGGRSFSPGAITVKRDSPTSSASSCPPRRTAPGRPCPASSPPPRRPCTAVTQCGPSRPDSSSRARHASGAGGPRHSHSAWGTASEPSTRPRAVHRQLHLPRRAPACPSRVCRSARYT